MLKNIPNLLTMGNLLLGVLALVYTLEGRYQTAISLVFIAMLLDGLDGKLASCFKAESDMGKQLDSLADLVSFGVTPAVVLYSIYLQQLAWGGILLTLLFPMAGAYRLARFNLCKDQGPFFQGLPITIAGGAIVSLGLYQDILPHWPVICLTLLLAVLMVSRISYPSLKGRQQEISIPVFLLFFGAVLAFIIFLFTWREAIPYLLFLYVATGPLFSLYRLIAGRILRRRERRFAELP